MDGTKLKKAIKKLGVSQAFIAEKLGVHKYTVNRWVNEIEPITEDRAKELTIFFKEMYNYELH